MNPLDIIIAGVDMFMECLSAYVLTCLIPVFFFRTDGELDL